MTYRPEFSVFSVCVVLIGFYFCDGLALKSKEEPKNKKQKKKQQNPKYSPTATCQAPINQNLREADSPHDES